MREDLALLPHLLSAHILLVLLSLFTGIAVSLPLGIFASRRPGWERAILAVAGIVQTIPGLALLAVMVPLLAACQLPSIGFLPAWIGLTLYSVLPVLRNTVTGITGLDPAVIEAARGIGMTPGQRLRIVELPLAMPVIVAGVRTAVVWLVGMATLSTPIGAPSLGNYIFSGLQTRHYPSVLVGCMAAATLALVLDTTVRRVEQGLVHRRRAQVVAAAGVLLILFLGSAGIQRSIGAGNKHTIRVGCKTFTEQYVLAEVFKRVVEENTTSPVSVISSLGSTVAFDALKAGELDLYVEYSGTVWATILKRSEVPEDRDQVLQRVAESLASDHQITVLCSLGFENTYALAMKEKVAARQEVLSILDLSRVSADWTIGGDYEFFRRPEWSSLRRVYDLSFAQELSMDPSLMYQAIDQKEVDVIAAYSTDGRIAAYDLRVLKDNRGAIPPYDAILLASEPFVRKHPDLVRMLKTWEGRIDASTMRELNRAVDADSRSPSEVAQEYLRR